MTITECLEAIRLTDDIYDDEEDKNYFLVHKFMDIFEKVRDEDIEILKENILEKYDYKAYSSFREYVCVSSKKKSIVKNSFPRTENIIADGTTILDFYNNYDENLIRFIKGHLFIEFAINKIIENALNSSIKKTVAKKIYLLKDNLLISEKEFDLLIALKNQRNEIAHNLNYDLTFEEMYNLVMLSVKAGVDYSDSTIYKNKKLSEEWYGIQGIIDEIFPNTFCHLLCQNEQYFENDEILKYMV